MHDVDRRKNERDAYRLLYAGFVAAPLALALARLSADRPTTA